MSLMRPASPWSLLTRIGIKASLLTLALAFAACNPNQAEESSTEETRYQTSGKPRIDVRLEEGSVTITASESNEVTAVFVKRARSLDRESARTLLDRIDVDSVEEGDRLRFEGRFESSPPVSFGLDLRTDLTLSVPPASEVDVYTGGGRIRLEGLAGRVSAETRDGRILVERASGTLLLRTAAGSIVGRDLRGTVDAESDDGEIDLDGSFARLRAVSSDGRIRIESRDGIPLSEEWELRTADGSISLRLPAGIDASIEATTSDGRIENGLRSFEGLEEGERLAGKLGRGGPLIFVSTMDGRVELTEN